MRQRFPPPVSNSKRVRQDHLRTYFMGGLMWGRTFCSEDSTGKFSCLTGDCGSGKLECSGGGAAPPATLAEFKLDGYGGIDYFDVSLVHGYNLLCWLCLRWFRAELFKNRLRSGLERLVSFGAQVTYGLAGNCIGKKDSLRRTAIERGALQRL
ncbi:hypothetical protein GH714_033311 [Hevea brasiliensis]|uniref:Uncharacterized protein n=1 Tax=Hevea brasiliensis TaxID=3981 RepID=A0A6A6L4P7_HEVBR|nr:hypothetical protein GH714_033311 [Hevea brasiliensis]